MTVRWFVCRTTVPKYFRIYQIINKQNAMVAPNIYSHPRKILYVKLNAA